MFYERTLQEKLLRLQEAFPIILVTGARQVGKSTLLRHANPGATYVTLDDPDLRQLARADPKLFLSRYEGRLIIDEVQYAPELFPILKMRVDEDRTPGRYMLSGSQQFHLMRNVGESLAGRVALCQLQPLSTREIQGDPGHEPFLPGRWEAPPIPLTHNGLWERIWRGGYPGLYENPDLSPTDFYASYVATYIQRDVRDLARVGDEGVFMRFMQMVAARTGQLLNVAQLANSLDISHGTAKNWLSILETSDIIYLLEPFHTNPEKRLVKTPKLYFVDTGLAAWLGRWPSPETLRDGAMAGAFLETYAVSEIRKSYLHQGLRPPMWFYRNADQREVDVLIVEGDTVYPIEVKHAATANRRVARSMDVAASLGLKPGPGCVLNLGETSIPITEQVATFPLMWL